MIQLPRRSACRSALVTGDDGGTVDARMCGGRRRNNGIGGGNDVDVGGNNPFDGLMRPPYGCVQQWKVNRDYISDLTSDDDGNTIFATSGDGTLSVFDVRYAARGGGGGGVTSSRSVMIAQQSAIDERRRGSNNINNDKTWETSGYAKSDEMEDELLSVVLMKNSQKLLVGTQDGTLCLYSYGKWEDMSDRYPGHPHSIDALLKVDEDTVLTGSSDGLIRAVQLLPNALLGVLGSHDGFPVEGLGWSAGREMTKSDSPSHIRI
ncbi:hypothetical protein ACHAW5_005666 [Stephanodiscus triporus]|uniref:WD repeat-containing protein 55 homolog n=1 Tax=Stephanodiscus triporus TaxID=2934178 RepID=A0ABD3PE10_9STRA